MEVFNLHFNDITLYPERPSEYSSRSEIDTAVTINFLTKKRWLYGNPIIASNMDTVGTISMAKALAKKGCFTALHKYHSNEDILNVLIDPTLKNNVFYTIGMNQESRDQLAWLENHVNFNQLQVCFEVANGYMQSFIDFIEMFAKKYPQCIIMAGNIISTELIQDYIKAGVDIIKVGIGNGSACTTSSTAAIGIPQYSVIRNFYNERYSNYAYYNKFLFCSDGGCKTYGDVTKALAGGADFVMLGGLLAGTDEAATAKFIDDTGHGYCEFYGMSSNTAMHKYGEKKSYRAAEGKTIQVPYIGPVENVIDEILGGIRSACTYLDCEIESLHTVRKVVVTK